MPHRLISEAEKQLAEDFLHALKERGASIQTIEAILKAGPSPIDHVVKAITQAAKLGHEPIAPHTELRRERLPSLAYNVLWRSEIRTFGILQCLSPSDIDDNCRNVGKKMIGEIESYVARHNCRLRGAREPVAERITEVFGSITTAPAVLALLLAWVSDTPFTALCKQYSIKQLGDFGKLRRDAIEKAFVDHQSKRLIEFLEGVRITLK